MLLCSFSGKDHGEKPLDESVEMLILNGQPNVDDDEDDDEIDIFNVQRDR